MLSLSNQPTCTRWSYMYAAALGDKDNLKRMQQEFIDSAIPHRNAWAQKTKDKLFGVWIFCLLPFNNSLPILLHVISIQSWLLSNRQQRLCDKLLQLLCEIYDTDVSSCPYKFFLFTCLIFYFQVPCFILYYVHMYYQDHHENQQQWFSI